MRPLSSFTTCKVCGYRDYEERFPNVHNSYEKYCETMKEWGHEGEITKGAGVVCPECGNYLYFIYKSEA